MVLQISENDGGTAGTTAEWENAKSGYEGAIDRLDRLGLIDRDRVGILGWSATGSTTSYLLTHSDYPITAAAFTDTGIYGWWYYLMSGAAQEDDAMFGAAPFGKGIAIWLERSPSFNLDRVRAPLLMWAARSVSGTWDWYSGLRRLGKAVEFWDLPTGTHDVYQASQRLKTNQLLVDWFVFWLKGEERTDVVTWGDETAQSLADQYSRWREFRKQQNEVLKQPRPPLLKWTATPVH